MRNILITGISVGLGHAMAKKYLQQGDRVYGCSRRNCSDLMDMKNLVFASIDLADLETLPQRLTNLIQNVDKFDIVILNAAALSEIKDLTETDLKSIKEVMDINVWANKIICDVLFQTQIKVDQVVTISSGAAVNGNRGWGAYAMSKATLNMLTQLYAAERPETHFCSLAPGIIDTAMQDYLCTQDMEKYSSLLRLKQAKGTPNMPDPEKAAEIICTAIPKLLSLASGSFADVRKL